jgi:beta-lactamase regulating signal transducer with metallopeptidase domain
MIATWMEATLRPLALALTVWAVLRIFRVRNVLALKCAWVLVLMAAFVAPFAAQWPLATVVVPVRMRPAAARAATAPAAIRLSGNAPAPNSEIAAAPKPLRHPRPELAAPDAARPGLPVTHAGGFSLLPVSQAPVAAPLSSPAPSYSFAQVAVGFYVAVAAALLLRLFYGLFSALRLWRSAQPVSAEIDALAQGLRLRASEAVPSPVTLGSAVLLPADHSEWDEEKLRVVLAHERSHIRQGDFYLQFLAGLYAALIWFSPLGWWLKRQLSELGEAISDRSGLQQAASRSAYAQILLEFAAAPRPTMIGVAMARCSKFSARIERLFDDRAFRQAYAPSRRTVFAAVLVTAAMFAATTLVRVEAATQAPIQAPPQTAPAAPAAASSGRQAKPPASPHSKTSPGQIIVPSVHVDVPAIHVNVPAVHVDEPAKTIDIPAVHVNVPEQHINIPAIENEPAKTIDIPAIHVNVPEQHVNIPAIHVDVPAVHVDEPAIHIDTPPAGKQDGSGGHASLGSTDGLLAMLNGFPGFGRASMRRAVFVQAASAQNAETFDRTLTFTGSLVLHIANGSGNIHLTRGTAGQVRVHARVYSRNASDAELVRSIAANPPIEQNGNVITIGGNLRRQGANHISIDYEIAAPADAALTASSGSGDIKDEGVGAGAKFSTGSGNIVATGLQSGFKAETGSGDISVENGGGGDAKVSSGSGDIAVKGVRGALVAETGSGNISAEGTPATAWRLATGSGNIELAPSNAPVTLDASTGAGSISSGRAMTTQISSNRHRVHAELNGGGVTVRLETGSGDIHIR